MRLEAVEIYQNVVLEQRMVLWSCPVCRTSSLCPRQRKKDKQERTVSNECLEAVLTFVNPFNRRLFIPLKTGFYCVCTIRCLFVLPILADMRLSAD